MATESTPEPDDGYIEVWNDLVSPRDLAWSLAICAATTAAALGIATLLSSSLFMWGLGGSVIGFVICTLTFHPKRDVVIVGDSPTNAVPIDPARPTN